MKYIVFITYKSRYGGRKHKRYVFDNEQAWLTWKEEWLGKFDVADVWLPTEANNFNLPK